MLSVVLPTFNEAENIETMVSQVSEVLKGTAHEIIVVDDDSPDGTWKIAEGLQSRFPSLSVMRRMGKKGLSSAVVDGFSAAKGNILAVMDADGQHDVELLTELSRAVERGAGITIGSRYIPGGDVGEWDGGRHILSRIATRMAMRVMRTSESSSVSDPMSGFFALRRDVFLDARPRLRPKGFKILLDLLLHAKPGTTVQEIPLKFGLRRAGESKLTWKVQWEFLSYLYDVTIGRTIGFGALLFALIVIGIVAILTPRVYRIGLLYLDPQLRERVQTELTALADRRGWLLSDVELKKLDTGSMTILHRPHARWTFPAECLTVHFSDHATQPCEK